MSTTPRIEKICDSFFYNQSIEEIKPVNTGHINQTLIVVVEGGTRYILQQINLEVFIDPAPLMENIYKVTRHLQQSDNYRYEVSIPVKDKNGHLMVIDEEEKLWRAFTYINDSETITRATTTETAWEAARAFGSFIACLSCVETSSLNYTISNFHNPIYRQQQFKWGLRNAIPTRLKKAFHEIVIANDNMSLFADMEETPLPLRITHNDTKINNVLFRKGSSEALAIIDLDTVMPGFIVHDFGDLIRSCACSTREDADPDKEKVYIRSNYYHAIKEGFLEGAGEILLPMEKENLFLGAKYIIFEQAIRFLSDYLQGDSYYPVEYEEHNLIRTKNQLAVLESLILQEKELEQSNL